MRMPRAPRIVGIDHATRQRQAKTYGKQEREQASHRILVSGHMSNARVDVSVALHARAWSRPCTQIVGFRTCASRPRGRGCAVAPASVSELEHGMGGRAVEGTGLENRQARKGLVGSNPTP